jgi:hypothetical protein
MSAQARAQNDATIKAQQSGQKITASGIVDLDASDKAYTGASFYVVDPNNNTLAEYVSFPNGQPAPGKQGVKWNGTTDPLVVKGNYTVTIKIQYVDSGNQTQTMKYSTSVNFQ